MAQVQASGLRIDTNFSSGQLSLHEYRKFLSRQDDTNMSPTSPRPRLKRKPAALNLCQRSHHDLGFQLQSPVSSAPSSPPPLSFSQSVISLPSGDLPTPISPLPILRPFTRPVSSSHSLGARRMVGFCSCVLSDHSVILILNFLCLSKPSYLFLFTLHSGNLFSFPITSLSHSPPFLSWFLKMPQRNVCLSLGKKTNH
jgi:hypothetical protein